MPAVQTTYAERISDAYAGMPASMANWNIDTRICETAAGIGFGLAVSQGTADRGVVIGGALNQFRGITVKDVTLSVAVQADEYQEGDNMGVMTQGDIWAVSAAQVAAGDAVHYSNTTGVLTNTGGNGPIVGASWMTSAAADGLAVVRLSGALVGTT